MHNQAQIHKSQSQYSENKEREIEEYKKKIQEISEIYLQQSNNQFFREIQEQQLVISQKDELIKSLKQENRKLKSEMKITNVSKINLLEELTELKHIRSQYSSASSIQPNQSYRSTSLTSQIGRRIFEHKTTLHHNNMSPKESCQEISPEKEISINNDRNQFKNRHLQQIIVQEVQTYDYSPKNNRDSMERSRVEQIIQKYSKSPVELNDIQIVQKYELLFDQFVIISAPKQNIIDAHNQNIGQSEFIVRPEIIFNHPDLNAELEHQLQLLPQYIYPYGMRVKLEEKTMSMSNLNSILMGGQSYDRLAGAYVIPMKSDQSFLKKKINIKNINQFSIYDVNITQLIAECNKEHIMYCVCVDAPDFYDYNINGENTNRSNNSQKKQWQKKYFYSVSKTYCFLTKAPLIDFFIEIIKIIINTLKYKKAEIYSLLNEPDETLSNIDNSFYTSFKPELYEFLTAIQNVKKLTDCSLTFMQTPLEIPQIFTKDPQLIEIEWASCYVFSHITLPHYLMLLLSILLEQNICIISKNRTLLSTILMVLPHSIGPFEFIHPIIFSLTHQLMPILDSPVPFLCGILRDKEYQLQDLGINDEEEFYDSQNHVIFFDADKLRFFNLPQDFTQTKLYDELFYHLFQTYQIIQNEVIPGHFLAENNEQTINIGIKIVKDTEQFIENTLINAMNLKLKDITLNIQDIAPNIDDELIQKMMKTQYYAYYLQQNQNFQ